MMSRAGDATVDSATDLNMNLSAPRSRNASLIVASRPWSAERGEHPSQGQPI